MALVTRYKHHESAKWSTNGDDDDDEYNGIILIVSHSIHNWDRHSAPRFGGCDTTSTTTHPRTMGIHFPSVIFYNIYF
jgi:hypothetical protein